MELLKSSFLDNIDLFAWFIISSFLVYLSYCGMENGNNKEKNKLLNKSKWFASFDFLFRLFRAFAICSFLSSLVVKSKFSFFYEQFFGVSLVISMFSFGCRDVSSNFSNRNNNKIDYWNCTHYFKRAITSCIIFSILFCISFTFHILIQSSEMEVYDAFWICFINSIVMFFIVKKIIQEPAFIESGRYYPRKLKYENWVFPSIIFCIMLLINPLVLEMLFGKETFFIEWVKNFTGNLKTIEGVLVLLGSGFIILFFGSKTDLASFLIRNRSLKVFDIIQFEDEGERLMVLKRGRSFTTTIRESGKSGKYEIPNKFIAGSRITCEPRKKSVRSYPIALKSISQEKRLDIAEVENAIKTVLCDKVFSRQPRCDIFSKWRRNWPTKRRELEIIVRNWEQLRDEELAEREEKLTNLIVCLLENKQLGIVLNKNKLEPRLKFDEKRMSAAEGAVVPVN